MLIIWLGALLVIGGVVFMAGQALWRARLSGRQSPAAVARNTLEPRKPAAGFGIASNWPGLVLVALGAILLLVGGAL